MLPKLQTQNLEDIIKTQTIVDLNLENESLKLQIQYIDDIIKKKNYCWIMELFGIEFWDLNFYNLTITNILFLSLSQSDG